jgi:hypothetical protein
MPVERLCQAVAVSIIGVTRHMIQRIRDLRQVITGIVTVTRRMIRVVSRRLLPLMS